MASKLSDQLRAAIDADPRSRGAICRAVELDPGLMSRFMSGKAWLGIETVDRLCELLGLKLVTAKKSRKPKGR
jgi:hypothetical protein